MALLELGGGERSPIWHCVLAALIPVIYIFAYMSIGGLYPQWDPAQYMETGLGIYNTFVDQGFVAGLKALYFHRGWRPSLAPVAIVPFYALTGGKALAAMHIVCPVLYSIFLLYVSLLLGSLLQGIRLVFALLLIGTQIALVTIGLDFWSELPYFVASVATVYHFYKCNNFQNRRHCVAAGVALGLALCCRPIVGGGTFAAPLFVYLYLSIRIGTIRWRDAGTWLLYAAAGMAIMGGTDLMPNNKSWAGLGLLGFLIATTIAFGIGNRRRFQLNTNNLLAASAAFALAVGWYGLFASEVYSWAFANTYGDLVRVHLTWLPHPREEPLVFLSFIAKNTVTAPTLGALLIALGAMVIRAFEHRKLPKPGSTTVLVGAMCIIPLLGTLTTYNGDPRYLIFPAFVLMLSCTAWFLMGAKSGASTMRRVAILSPALLLQVVFLASKMVPFPENVQTRFDRQLLSPIFPPPLPRWISQTYPAEPVYERILELVGGAKRSRIGVIIPQAFFYLNLPAVNVIAAQNKQNIVLNLASYYVPRGPGLSDDYRVQQLSQEFSHLLIGPLSDWERVPNPIRSVGNYLLDQHSRRENENASVLVPSMNSDDVREFVLVRIDSGNARISRQADKKVID